LNAENHGDAKQFFAEHTYADADDGDGEIKRPLGDRAPTGSQEHIPWREALAENPTSNPEVGDANRRPHDQRSTEATPAHAERRR